MRTGIGKQGLLYEVICSAVYGSVRVGTNNCGNAFIIVMHDWEAYNI